MKLKFFKMVYRHTEKSLDDFVAEYREYYELYGQDGFLSERMVETDILCRAERAFAYHESNRTLDMIIGKIAVTGDTDPKMSKIEQLPDFRGWI